MKLADFGLCKIVQQNQTINDLVGTQSYVAPEVLKEDEYNLKVDVWSLGVVFFILTTGSMPFKVDSRDDYWKAVNERLPISK